MRRRIVALLAGLCAAALLSPTKGADADRALTVGSKRFTESYILGELATDALKEAGVDATHRPGLGNTAILAQALASGEIDLYPEYTGTIARELLQRPPDEAAAARLDQLNAWLAEKGMKAAVPLGFNNTYALAMRTAQAEALGIRSLGDLARLPPAEAAALRYGLSHEFLQRADGWPGLRRAYGLAATPGNGLDHGLAYAALRNGQVDVIDVYTTDAQLGRDDVRVLADDRGYFPRYDAVLLMRADVDAAPLARALQDRIDEATMIRLNAEVELQRRPYADVAREALTAGLGNVAPDPPSPAGSAGPGATVASHGADPTGASTAQAAPGPRSTGSRFWRRLWAPDLPRLLVQHLALVFGSLALAVLVGVPLGIAAARRPRLSGAVMAAVGLMQTVPSLALLAFLIAALGTIGFVPALLALFVYALLPIVRNTHAGLVAVPHGLVQAGTALGLRSGQVLQHVELPLALPTLLAGVKTAAVINVGTATVAAFVGAGGLGERIVSGLAVNDNAQMLAGAVPAAALALLIQAGFDVAERLSRRGGVPPRGAAGPA